MKKIKYNIFIKEKRHNDDKYKIEVNEYNISPNEIFVNIMCEIVVKMKFLFFWITIWKEFVNGSEFKTIDDYRNEVEYSKIKAEDILKLICE